MPRQHHRSPEQPSTLGRIVRGVASAVVLAALLAGLPWLLLVVTGSPFPDRLPTGQDVIAALMRRDDGTLLLATLKYIAWIGWALWATLVAVEAAARVAGRVAPRIPGLSVPQNLAAVLVGGLGAAVLGTSMTFSRASALPPQPAGVTATAPPPAAPHQHDQHEHDQHEHDQTVADPHASVSTPARVLQPGSSLATGSSPLAAAPPAQAPSSSNESSSGAPGVTVRFAFDSAELTPAARSALTQLAADIRTRADPRSPVVIVGHTDSCGPAAYNQRLSLQRAETVHEALDRALGHGYRFHVGGKGETAPVAAETRPGDGDDPTGRARNRRVEITYTLKPATQPAPTPTPEPTASDSPHPGTTGSPAPGPSSPGGGAGVPAPPNAPERQRPSTAPTASPPSSSPSSPQQLSPTSDERPGSDPVSVRLPSGALVGLGLAAAISVAVAAGRLHRRHRRVPDPDRLAVAEPEPSQGAAVRTLRKAHLDSAALPDGPAPSDQQLVDDDFAPYAPEQLEIGERDGQSVSMPLSGLNVGLTGPGAAAAVRAIATELLAGAHRHRIELLIPTGAAATVFGLTDHQVDRLADIVPGLTVTPDLGAALRYLETEILHRARLMSDHEVADVPALRTADPGEPLPAIVLFAQADQSERFSRTLQAVLHLAASYGIGALLLGTWPDGTTCRINPDGHVVHAQGPDADTWAGLRLFHLTSGDTTELLQTIRTARGDEPASAAPAAPSTSAPEPASEAPPDHTRDSAPAAAPLQSPPRAHDRDCPVRVRLIGPVRVETTDQEVSTGLRRISRDLLALLALHPDGLTREQGIDAIWPDRDIDGGSTMFHTAVNNARKRLREVTGLREPMFITHVAGRYCLDPHLIDVDLWHFLHALEAAATADNDPDRIPALRRIADLYTAELAEDLTYEWAERERERIRRTATDALVRLARILQDDAPDEALPVLEQAFEHDPFSEPLACELMRLQARLGNIDGARRTYRLLAYRLNDLDIDPAPDTERLVSDLVRQHDLAQRRAAAQHQRLPADRSRPHPPQTPGT